MILMLAILPFIGYLIGYEIGQGATATHTPKHAAAASKASYYQRWGDSNGNGR